MHDNIPTLEGAAELLEQTFGLTAFLPGQEAAVSRLLAGKSVLTIFPTGGGKSLCFQLPGLMFDGLTLVISPLIALMKDQLDFLQGRGVPAARLDSSLNREETLAVYDQLNAGDLKILYVSPERLNNERFLKSLGRRKISLLAIDEAHCISEWGHNFRPDYLKIAKLARQLRVERVLGLTATATPRVARDISAAFDIAEEDVVHTGFYRPNLRLAVTPCRAAERNDLLLTRLAKRDLGPTIVYVTLQRTAEQVAEMLAKHGYNASAYHAGMESEQRTAIQDAFMASDRMIVVATIAFGMGIDKRDIRYVYHYNLPKSLESYSQEIGRAGRDGKDSICELLACPDDMVVLENFSYGDTPTPEAVASLVAGILGDDEEFDISVHELSRKHDVRPVVVRTLLTYLELEDILESTGPFYTGFKFQPQRSSQEILEKFNPQRAEFLRRVFRHAKQGKTWYSLDADEAARAIGEPRERIVAALGYLEETGDLILHAAGLREGYRRRAAEVDREALCQLLAQRFQQRETHDIDRIRDVLRFAEEKGCLTRHLLAYFGENRDNCGHCALCQGKAPQLLPPPSYRKLDDADTAVVRELIDQRHEALSHPRQLTRFLCGISSPATSRAKLRRHAAFGRYDDVPFHEVLTFVEGL